MGYHGRWRNRVAPKEWMRTAGDDLRYVTRRAAAALLLARARMHGLMHYSISRRAARIDPLEALRHE
jgi:hypothetical protein